MQNIQADGLVHHVMSDVDKLICLNQKKKIIYYIGVQEFFPVL